MRKGQMSDEDFYGDISKNGTSCPNRLLDEIIRGIIDKTSDPGPATSDDEELTEVEQPTDLQSLSSKEDEVVENIAFLQHVSQNGIPEANSDEMIENENSMLVENEVSGRKQEEEAKSCIQENKSAPCSWSDFQHEDTESMQEEQFAPLTWSDNQHEDTDDIKGDKSVPLTLSDSLHEDTEDVKADKSVTTAWQDGQVENTDDLTKTPTISCRDDLGTEETEKVEKLHILQLKKIDDKNGKTAYCASDSYLLDNQSTAANGDKLHFDADFQTAAKNTNEREPDKTVSSDCEDKHDMLETVTEVSTEKSLTSVNVKEKFSSDAIDTTGKDPKTGKINLLMLLMKFLVVSLTLFGVMTFMFKVICCTKTMGKRKPTEIFHQNKSVTVRRHVDMTSHQNESFLTASNCDTNYSISPNYSKLLPHTEHQEPWKQIFQLSKCLRLDLDVTEGGNLTMVVEEEKDDGSCLSSRRTTQTKKKNGNDGGGMTLRYLTSKAGKRKRCRVEYKDSKSVKTVRNLLQTPFVVEANLKEPRRTAHCLLEFIVNVVAMPPRSLQTPDDDPAQSTRLNLPAPAHRNVINRVAMPPPDDDSVQCTRLDLPLPDLPYVAQHLNQRQTANPAENRNLSVLRVEITTVRYQPRSNRSDGNTMQENNYLLRNATYPPGLPLAVDIYERSQMTQGSCPAELARRVVNSISSFMIPGSELKKEKRDSQQQEGNKISIDGDRSNVLGGFCEPLQSPNNSKKEPTAVSQEENDANSSTDDALQQLRMKELTRRTNPALQNDKTSDKSPPKDRGEATANIRNRIRQRPGHEPELTRFRFEKQGAMEVKRNLESIRMLQDHQLKRHKNEQPYGCASNRKPVRPVGGTDSYSGIGETLPSPPDNDSCINSKQSQLSELHARTSCSSSTDPLKSLCGNDKCHSRKVPSTENEDRCSKIRTSLTNKGQCGNTNHDRESRAKFTDGEIAWPPNIRGNGKKDIPFSLPTSPSINANGSPARPIFQRSQSCPHDSNVSSQTSFSEVQRQSSAADNTIMSVNNNAQLYDNGEQLATIAESAILLELSQIRPENTSDRDENGGEFKQRKKHETHNITRKNEELSEKATLFKKYQLAEQSDSSTDDRSSPGSMHENNNIYRKSTGIKQAQQSGRVCKMKDTQKETLTKFSRQRPASYSECEGQPSFRHETKSLRQKHSKMSQSLSSLAATDKDDLVLNNRSRNMFRSGQICRPKQSFSKHKTLIDDKTKKSNSKVKGKQGLLSQTFSEGLNFPCKEADLDSSSNRHEVENSNVNSEQSFDATTISRNGHALRGRSGDEEFSAATENTGLWPSTLSRSGSPRFEDPIDIILRSYIGATILDMGYPRPAVARAIQAVMRDPDGIDTSSVMIILILEYLQQFRGRRRNITDQNDDRCSSNSD